MMTKRPHILIMEDDENLARLYLKVLSRTDYDTLAVHTIAEARHVLGSLCFDGFICDLHLEGESSINLLRDYYPRFAKDKTQVIIVSGQDQLRAICEQLGFEFFLSKPVSPSELVTMMERLVSINPVFSR